MSWRDWISQNTGSDQGAPVIKTGIGFIDAFISFGAVIVAGFWNIIFSLFGKK